jgi:DNA-binding transcriptional MerR regulator
MGAKSKTPRPNADEAEKPAGKLAYRFEEVSRLTGASVEALEAWEKEFPYLNAGRTGSGQKFFRQGDVEIIRRIQELVSGKNLTLAGIRRQVEKEFGLAPAEPLHPDKLRKALFSLRDELSELANSLGTGRGKKVK